MAFTVLLVGLGLDFAIHLLLHVQERRAAGQSIREALDGAVHEVGPALALAAPTTALAFLSFVPTSFDGIAQLGVIAGVGRFDRLLCLDHLFAGGVVCFTERQTAAIKRRCPGGVPIYRERLHPRDRDNCFVGRCSSVPLAGSAFRCGPNVVAQPQKPLRAGI